MWAVVCALLIVGVVIFIFNLIFLVGMVSGISSAGKGETVAVRNNTFLTVDLAKPFNERSPNGLMTFMGESQSQGLCDVVNAITAAADDSHVKGILLRNGAVAGLSWGSAEELREALLRFHESGKPIVAYGDSYSQSGYYLSSVADRICVHPSGMIDLRGIGSQVMYYKDLLDKLDVKMQLFRPESCSYKSAGEVYTMNHMSEANREQIKVYINSIWDHVAHGLSQSRHLSVADINRLADNLQACLPQDALSAGVVDTLCFEADVKRLLRDQYGAKHLLSASKYFKQLPASQAKEAVAVVYAEGNVLDGSGNGMETAVYGRDIVHALDAAAKDDNVKAIVMRVNSPGGAVTASESMTAAVLRAKEKKPVVVSMSDLAASAGYEISCNATCIVAQPTTITGSIGVFATLPNVGGLLKHKLGLAVDTAQTNRNSTGLSVLQPLSPAAMAMLTRNVEDFYVTFVDRVATGRGLRHSYVDSIARGRVWTGRDALQNGLVDTLGGLQLAIRIAADAAGLDEYRVAEYPKEKDTWSQLMSLTGKEDDEDSRLSAVDKVKLAWQARQRRAALPEPLGRVERELLNFCNAEGLQARLPYVVISE